MLEIPAIASGLSSVICVVCSAEPCLLLGQQHVPNVETFPNERDEGTMSRMGMHAIIVEWSRQKLSAFLSFEF